MASKKILLVDDDPNLVAILGKRLTASGYEVCTAVDGAEALVMVQSQKPDLIVMDVMMPKMTGYLALQKIRETDAFRKIPAIIISAKPSMREFFTDLHGVEFVPKPYETRILLSRIERLLWESEEQSPDGYKRVVLFGGQEALTQRLQMAIQGLGFQAFIALNGEDAFHLAQQLNPGNILCQFCEDAGGGDVHKLKEKLGGHPLLSEVPFYVYCEERLSGEARKTFADGRVIIYSDENELLEKLADLFKEM